MATPVAKQLVIVGAKVVQRPAPGSGQQVAVNPGDAIAHEDPSGWHVALKPHFVPPTTYNPTGGSDAGFSNDLVHWSSGASYSGMGVPSSYSPASYDQASTGYGTDGRISGSGATGKPAF
jgi:hypothetical protein